MLREKMERKEGILRGHHVDQLLFKKKRSETC